jgi:hypothetical protein
MKMPTMFATIRRRLRFGCTGALSTRISSSAAGRTHIEEHTGK